MYATFVQCIVPCPLKCKDGVSACRVEEHVLSECPKRIITCEKCKVEIRSEERETHDEQDCLSNY